MHWMDSFYCWCMTPHVELPRFLLSYVPRPSIINGHPLRVHSFKRYFPIYAEQLPNLLWTIDRVHYYLYSHLTPSLPEMGSPHNDIHVLACCHSMLAVTWVVELPIKAVCHQIIIVLYVQRSAQERRWKTETQKKTHILKQYIWMLFSMVTEMVQSR